MFSNHAVSLVVHFVRCGYLHMFENKTPYAMWNLYAGEKKLVIPLSLTAEWEEQNLLCHSFVLRLRNWKH